MATRLASFMATLYQTQGRHPLIVKCIQSKLRALLYPLVSIQDLRPKPFFKRILDVVNYLRFWKMGITNKLETLGAWLMMYWWVQWKMKKIFWPWSGGVITEGKRVLDLLLSLAAWSLQVKDRYKIFLGVRSSSSCASNTLEFLWSRASPKEL